ncbi:hypothetical protein CGLO_15906 [Colletotrichum gloeosporioides Cg-14]|uniref:Uncharacterized protein n=1 Tax=Colletotrichum gloeosporioides (strain Cg-14) TaxID=1237896 RepID=T0JXP9_COLGC|nr:hypothetical protein CGLO_15906 [Colletotrichum gloeosporioides Cg-14]
MTVSTVSRSKARKWQELNVTPDWLFEVTSNLSEKEMDS